MADKREGHKKGRASKSSRARKSQAHRESFAGADIAGDEAEQTRDRERAGRVHTDEVGEITETELDDGESL